MLLDERGVTATFFAALDALEARGPAPLTEPEARLRRTWPRKMLLRAARGDAEGNYRRAWLLKELLESYYELRGRWYRGPKLAVADLVTSDPVAHAAFVAALEPGAPLAAIEALVEVVTGPWPA